MIYKQREIMRYFSSFKMQMFFAFALAAMLCLASSINGRAQSAPTAGELDSSLNVNIDSYPGNVRATVVQPDGKILVAGFFRTVNGVRQKSIARLNADFSLDTTFSANVGGAIQAVAVQTDGKILIGGSFLVAGGANHNRIARLNANGSVDATFNASADNTVYDVVVQADGKILVGGNFSRVNGANNYGVARLNADGSIDASFVSPIPAPTPTPNPPFQTPSIVYSIALQADGKIVIGGYIVKSYATLGTVVTPIARLNTNGAFDSSFNPGTINSNAQKVAVQPDGKILMAGFSTTVNGVNRNYIARFNADGSLDASFNIGTGANSPVLTMYLQPDGKILLAGLFSSFNGKARNRVARLNPDGSLDDAFNPGSNSFIFGTVQSIVSLPNGKVIVGGAFAASLFFNSDSIKVFNADGSTDSSVRFETTALGGVRAIAVQPDGKILVGGNFNRPRSNSLSQIFRLNADGSLDQTFGSSSQGFSSSSSGQVNSIVVQPDGKILIAGFNIVVSDGNGGFLGTDIARLNADGTTDTSFIRGNIPTSVINAVALQPDGKIIVVWGRIQPNGFPVGGIARLNSNGSIDASFNSDIPGLFFDSVVVQPDGKILVGGPFSFIYVSSQTGGIPYNGVVRLNSDGSRDPSFVPATVSNYDNGRVTEVHALALQPDGKVLIGGRIFAVGTTVPIGVARLNSDGTLDETFSFGAIYSIADVARVEDVFLLPNGKILVGGLFDNIGAATQSNIARLNADGTPDNSFITRTDNTVYDVAVQADGKVLIGGDFETVNDVPRTALARLLSEPVARRTQFDFDGDGKADVSTFRPSNGTWYLLNSQSGFTAFQFGAPSDRIVPADYDGDGKTDVAVFRNGTWYLQRSSLGFAGVSFGSAEDTPAPADFDGDGKAELAVYRPSNGTWYIYNLATNQTSAVQFGASEDVPVAADYDGDGRADIAVFRPSTGTWYLQRSQLGFTGVAFGQTGDRPVPADYDGDGKTDVAVFRSGTWYLLRSGAGFTGIAFGEATDLPVPADYDGDGKADVSVFRPSTGTWYLQRSQSGFTGVAFGASGDKPIPNAFVP